MAETVQDILAKLAKTQDYNKLNNFEIGLLTRFLHDNAAKKKRGMENHGNYHDYDDYLVGDEPMKLIKTILEEDGKNYYNEIILKYDNDIFTFRFWEIEQVPSTFDFNRLVDFDWSVSNTENLILNMIKELDDVNEQISVLLKRRAELTDSINSYNDSLSNVFVNSFSEKK